MQWTDEDQYDHDVKRMAVQGNVIPQEILDEASRLGEDLEFEYQEITDENN